MNGEEAEKLRRQLAEAINERDEKAATIKASGHELDAMRSQRDAAEARRNEADHRNRRLGDMRYKEAKERDALRAEAEALRKQLTACQESRDGYANAYHDYAAKIAVVELERATAVANIKGMSEGIAERSQRITYLADRLARAEGRLEAIRDYPHNGGYPEEISYDEFAYRRLVDSYRRVATDYFESTEPEGKASSGTDKNGLAKAAINPGSSPEAHAGTGVESGSVAQPQRGEKCQKCAGRRGYWGMAGTNRQHWNDCQSCDGTGRTEASNV
jgi:hypothetical protein